MHIVQLSRRLPHRFSAEQVHAIQKVPEAPLARVALTLLLVALRLRAEDRCRRFSRPFPRCGLVEELVVGVLPIAHVLLAEPVKFDPGLCKGGVALPLGRVVPDKSGDARRTEGGTDERQSAMQPEISGAPRQIL